MKRLVTLAATFALSLPVAAFAEEPKLKAEPGKPSIARAVVVATPENAGGEVVTRFVQPFAAKAAFYIEQTDKVVKLTPEQKARIEKLFEVREHEVREIQARIAAKSQVLSRDLSRANELKDQAAMAAVQKAYAELYAPMTEFMKKSNEALEEILTPEQRAKLAVSLRPTLPAGVAVAQVTSPGTPGGTVQIQIGESNDKAVLEEIITRVKKEIAASENDPVKRELLRRMEELQKSTHAAEFAKAQAEIQQKHAEIQRKHAEVQQKVAESHRQATQQQEEIKRQLEAAIKQQHASHRAGMRDRVRRQRELTKQATKLLKKLDELDSDESPKARELWKQLEQTQAELQQTFGGPQAFSISTAPGQPAGTWVVRSSEGLAGGGAIGGGLFGGGGVVSSGNVIISSPQVQSPANPTAVHVRELKVASPPPTAAPQPSNADVLKAVETISRKVQQLEERITKMSPR